MKSDYFKRILGNPTLGGIKRGLLKLGALYDLAQ